MWWERRVVKEWRRPLKACEVEVLGRAQMQLVGREAPGGEVVNTHPVLRDECKLCGTSVTIGTSPRVTGEAMQRINLTDSPSSLVRPR